MGLAQYLFRKLAKLFTKPVEHFIENPLFTFGEMALKKGTCCICGKKLREPSVKEGQFSLLPIYKKATWEEPQVTMTTRTGESYGNFAAAVICAGCENSSGENIIKLRNSVKYAVELDMRRKNLVYHDVKKLEDYPLVIEG